VTNRNRRSLLQLVVTVLLLVALYLARGRPATAPGAPDAAPDPPASGTAPAVPRPEAAPSLKDLVQSRRSGVEIETGGRVVRLLPDDREGARHERFLVRIEGVSVLVAHNLDLAPRVPLEAGDSVQLRGEYEWNEKGGVIHWTHRDPDGRHDAGWIRHEGRLYQ
jgi:Protein of unknown function (DUF3465)